MAETILGIQIGSTYIKAVQIKKTSLKKFVVSRASKEIITGITAEEKAEQLREFILKNRLESDRFVANFPARRVFYRSTFLPFSDEKKIARTVKYEFEPTLPVPVEGLVCGFSKRILESGRTQVFGALVSKEDLSQYLDILEQAGVEPEVVTLDSAALGGILRYKSGQIDQPSLVIKIDYDACETVWSVYGKTMAIRKLHSEIISTEKGLDRDLSFDRIVETSVAEIERCVEIFKEKYGLDKPKQAYLTGELCEEYEFLQAFQKVLMDSLGISSELLVSPGDPAVPGLAEVLGKERAGFSVALGLALLGLSKNDALSLRQDEFAAHFSLKSIKKDLVNVGIGLCIVLMLLMGNLVFQVSTDKKVYNYWKGKIEREFQSVFPKGTRMVKPVQQLESRVNEAKKMVEFFAGEEYKMPAIDILREIHEKIKPEIKVGISSLSIDPDSVRMSGNTDSFNTVDTIKKVLESSEYFKSIKITNAKVSRRGKGINFKMLIGRAK